MKDLSSRFSQSFGLLLFQIFSEISQSHIALLQEGIVHGEGSTHALWLVALLGKLQILTQHRAVIWMGTVFDNLLGTSQWAFATEIGYSLFGNNHIYIVLGTVHVTEQMGHNVADFLVSDLKKGHIPPQFLPLQSGVGVTSNAVLEALGQNPNVPVFSVYTEVVQDAVVKYMREGRIKDASCSSLTVTNDTLKEVYDDIDYFKKHLTIRQSEISNSPEVIRRLGVIAMNTAIECDIYGNENSSHICGSKLMNGIGGSCDYERNGFISIFTTQSTTKNGCISAIVPMCSHVDSTEHDVDVIVTEQGVADLRGKGPLRRAKEIIENCAHPDYRPMLREYLKFAEKGHEPQSMRAALAMHDTFLKKGDMRLTDFGEYLK